jgi:hypothetical protein
MEDVDKRYASTPKFRSMTFSTHLWQGAVPRELAPGGHPVVVDVVDDYGQRHRSAGVVEVTP